MQVENKLQRSLRRERRELAKREAKLAQVGKRNAERSRLSLTQYTSTVYCDKFIQMSAFPKKQCQSWIALYVIFSTDWQPRQVVLHTRTPRKQFRLEKSRHLFVSFCLVSWQSMPSVKEQKPSQNTPAPSRFVYLYKNGLFQDHTLKKVYLLPLKSNENPVFGW